MIDDRCPVCNSAPPDVVEGEYVSVGVGMRKVSGDYCTRCGWEELGMNATGNELTTEQLEKLWEIQIAPYDILRYEQS